MEVRNFKRVSDPLYFYAEAKTASDDGRERMRTTAGRNLDKEAAPMYCFNVFRHVCTARNEFDSTEFSYENRSLKYRKPRRIDTQRTT